MRGKYRHTFLRISAEGEETNQSANLKVNSDKTLPIIIESVRDLGQSWLSNSRDSCLQNLQTPTPTVSSVATPISTGPFAKLSTMAQLLTPISNGLDLDGTLATPFHQRDSVQRVGGAKKRKRDASLTHIQPPALFDSSDGGNLVHAPETSGQAMSSPSDHNPRPRKSRRNRSVSSIDDGYKSDSPSGAYRGSKSLRKDLGPSASHLHHAGYETDQPLSSVRSRLSSRAREQHHGPDRNVGSRLQLPPSPADNARRLHDKIVSFLQNEFMQDAPSWNEFSQNCAQIRSLSNAMLLKIYWYAQGRLDDWVGASTPEYLQHKKVEIVRAFFFSFLSPRTDVWPTLHRNTSSVHWESMGIGTVSAIIRCLSRLRMVKEVNGARILALLQLLVTVRTRSALEILDPRICSCCYARYMRSIAKGSTRVAKGVNERVYLNIIYKVDSHL